MPQKVVIDTDFGTDVDDAIGNVEFLHDPLTLAFTFDAGWCNFQPVNLELALTNNFGLRWIEREPSVPGTIGLNCALSVNEQNGQTFQDWLVQRLLYRFP